MGRGRSAGQIIPRGPNKHLVRVDLGRDVNGKRQRLSQTVNGSKTDARKVLTQMLAEKDSGKLLEPSRITLNSFLDQWLPTMKTRLAESTHEDYVWNMAKYIRPKIGQKRLSKLNSLEIQAVYNEMLARGLSNRTVGYAHTIFRQGLDQAVEWRMITVNPANAIKPPKRKKKEMQALNAEEAQRFIAAAKADNHFVLFYLLITTGLRPGEAVALKWSDLEVEAGSLSVNRTVHRPKGGGWNFQTPKTLKSRRKLDLPSSLIELLIVHKESCFYGEHDLMFPNINGEPLDSQNLAQRNFKDILKAAGLKKIRLYDLRHTCATLLLLAGVHPKVVSERLGHSSIRETLDTYSHVLPSMQKEANAALEALLAVKQEGNKGDSESGRVVN